MTGALPPPDPVYGSPTAPELLDAVEHFLRHGTDGLAPLAAFHARVAANAVATVARELRTGEAARARVAAAYAALGVADEAGLAAAVRAGRLDDRPGELRSALEVGVRARLDAVHPGYAGPGGAAGRPGR